MADDRYDWLDEEAAELLLRGLPVDAPCDGQERLVAVLAALRQELPVSAEDGELPGEAAALAAFRAARPTAPTAPAAPARTGSALVGRVLAACRPPVRSAGRPLRAGLAVAVAGFALGGVAVAAGAGVLPTPFDGGPTGPAVSVSPMRSPSTGAAGGAEGATDRPDPSGGPDAGGSAGSPGAFPGATPTPDGGRAGAEDGHGGTTGDTHRPAGPGHGPQLSEVDQEALVDTLCSAYTNGELNADERRRLERAAGSAEAVRTFCADHGVTAGEESTGGEDTGGRDSRRPTGQASPSTSSPRPPVPPDPIGVVGGANGGLPDGGVGGAGADHRSGGHRPDPDGDEPSPAASATPSESASPTPSVSAGN